MTREKVVASTPLWHEFKAAQLAANPAQEQRLQAFDVETKKHRADLFLRLKIEQQKTLAGLTGPSKKAEQSLQKFNSATVKAEFNEERRALRKALQPTQAEAWRIYLQACAQAGNEEALARLRKLDDTARAAPAWSITGTIHLDGDEEEKKRRRLARESAAAILKMLVHTVERNGDVTYHQHGRAILRDEGQYLAVLDEDNEAAIAAALLLGREKFGMNLTVTGSPEFQRRVVAVAVAQGIQVKFNDPQLETLRVQLTASKHQPMRQQVTPSNQPAQRDIEPATQVLTPTPEQAAAGVAEAAQEAETRRLEKEEKAAAEQLEKSKEPAKVAPAPLHSPSNKTREAVPSAQHQPETKQPNLLDKEVQKPEDGYEKWLAKEVQKAIDDPRPSIPHDEVMAEWEAEELPPVDYLDDIHRQIAAAKNANEINKGLPVVLAVEAVDARGPILASNRVFVAVSTGRQITIFRIDDLENVVYDGTCVGSDRFAKGNKLEIKPTKEGLKTVVGEGRPEVQTEAKKKIVRERGLGRG